MLEEIKNNSEESIDKLLPILDISEMQKIFAFKGNSFVNVKFDVLQGYLQSLLYYIMLKLQGKSTANHPVINKIASFKK
jgi:hypothetical protein